LRQYRETEPYAGFEILKTWGAGREVKDSAFVLTSNVDGQFQKAGFDSERVVEIHGSIFLVQCARLCSRGIWSVVDIDVEVDAATMRAVPPVPSCPRCGGVARPNIVSVWGRGVVDVGAVEARPSVLGLGSGFV